MFKRIAAFLMFCMMFSVNVFAVVCDGVNIPDVTICSGDTNVDCDGEYIDDADGPEDGPILYKAVWEAKTYSISYYSGLHGSAPAGVNDPVVYQNGLTYNESWDTEWFDDVGFIADTGYVFSHWNTNVSDTGTTYQEGESQPAWETDNNLSLYAIYDCDTANGYIESNGSCVKQYSVDFYCHQDDVSSSVSSTFLLGENYTGLNRSYMSSCGCREPGYYFNDWVCTYESNGLTYQVYNNDSVVPYDVTCVPEWSPMVADVEYNPGAHGTGGNLVSDALEYGQSFAPASGNGANITVASGYKFIGWSQTSNSMIADFCSATASTPCVSSTNYWPGTGCYSADLLLYAVYDCDVGYHWNNDNTACIKNEIDLIWNLNGGDWQVDANQSELSNQESCVYGLTNGITVHDPASRRGYSFDGWLINAVSN